MERFVRLSGERASVSGNIRAMFFSRYILILYILLINSGLGNAQNCPGQNKYNLNQNQATSTCLVWGKYHVKTFDDHSYNFDSECGFKLVSLKAGALEFLVDVFRWNNVCTKKNNCGLTIQISFDGIKHKVDRDEQGLVRYTIDGNRKQLPFESDGVRVHQPSRRLKIEFTEIGINVNWDTASVIEIVIDNGKGYQVWGLCGNMDRCSTNDQMLVNGLVTDNLKDFIEEWQIDKQSCPTPIVTQSKCGMNKFKMQEARDSCKILEGNVFAEARKVLDPAIFLDACLSNACGCRDRNNPANCLCDTLDAYAKASVRAGAQPSRWRNDNMCPIKCPAPLFYQPCAPAGGTKTCGADEQNAVMNKPGECEEGCYCLPLNYVFQNKCYLKKNCPCFYNGAVIQPKGTVTQDCHTCTCTDGKIVCPQFPLCRVEAIATGDPHYTTWDGKRFDFMGKCSYYLMKGADFTVEASHEVYHGGKFIKSDMKLPSYTRRIIIKMAGEVVDLKPGPEVVVNGIHLKRFPHKTGEIIITKPANNMVLVDLPNGVQVYWDGYSTGRFKLPTTMEGQVLGLLGYYDGDKSNDFMTPTGEVVNDPVTFGNSWKTEGSCLDEPKTPLQHPCDMYPAAKPAAEKICQSIKGDIFKQCGLKDPQTIYENCVYDTCFCRDDPNKCSCDQIAIVAGECGAKKIVVNWRNKIPECRLPCPAGQMYQECGDVCARTCEDLSMRPNCVSECVEGCNCAPGTAMDEDGKCVPIAQCKCRIDNIVYQPGFQYLDKKTDELYTCKDARWVPIPPSAEQRKIPGLEDLDKKCDPENFSIYTPCRYPQPKTCYNMHVFEITSIEHCEEGCECKNGFVLDPRTNTCVRNEECPCYDKGRSYETGAVTVQEDCNRCTCSAEGTWNCKEEDCDNLCIENEVKQEDCNICKCKDAFWECTKRDCSQKCATEGETKKVDCNTCVCTDGFWSCTLKECGRECNENDVKHEGCKTCNCAEGLWKCNEDKCLTANCDTEGAVKFVDYGKCVCKGGTWRCSAGQCDVWGDSHIKTFDTKRYDFQGECSYVLAEGKLDDIRFSLTFATERCSHAGATCLKSATIDVEVNGVQESISLVKGAKPDAGNLKKMTLRDQFLFTTIDIVEAGIHVFWDKKTWVYIKLDEKWQSKVEGLCGNYNRLVDDDLQMFDVRQDDNAVLAFVDRWRTRDCEMTRPNTDTCDKDRRGWASEQCKILRGPTFSQCHSTVPVDSYYEACVADSCKCDLGGDCECLCTAISAYAQQCNNYGIPIRWRSQELCPIQCAKNTQYEPCMKACPQKTCETIRENKVSSCDPDEELCTEGCAPEPLPEGYVYTDANYDRHVKEEKCSAPKCGEFYDGETMVQKQCEICVCVDGQKKCIDLPCSDDHFKPSEPPNTEFPPTAKPGDSTEPGIKTAPTDSPIKKPTPSPDSTEPGIKTAPTDSPIKKPTPSPDACSFPADSGTCKGYFPKYYYDTGSGTCKQFIYGGCEGNANRFSTIEECHELCGSREPVDQLPSSTAAPTPPATVITTPWPNIEPDEPTLPPDCDRSKCPILSCPKTITTEVQLKGQCCKSCQHESKCVVRLQYNRRILLKKPGQEWMDGPCKECACVGEEKFNHCTQCRSKVCSSVKARNVTIGNTYYEYSRGPCCPKMEPVACVHNNKLYRVGELWEIDQCTSMKCERDAKNNLTVTLVLSETCNEKCPIGFVYKKTEKSCCGECIQHSCIIGDTTRKLGEKWFSDDGCTIYACASVRGQYRVLSQKTLCPPVPPCANKIVKGRCCEYCDSTELFTWKNDPTNCNSIADTIPPAV